MDQSPDTQRLLGRLDERTESLIEEFHKVRETNKSLADNLQRLVDMGVSRDTEIKAIRDKQSDMAHTAASEQHRIGLQIEDLSKKVDTNHSTAQQDMTALKGDLKAQVVRIENLEAPVRAALAQRAKRRRTLIRIVSVAAAVASGMWVLLDPIWHFFADTLLKKWFGN